MGNELTAVDDQRTRDIIWKYIGRKSVSEIADLTGLKPNDVLTVSREMLTSVDALTIDQQITKALIDLNEIAARAMEAFDRASDERSWAPLLSSATGAIKTNVAILKDIQKNNNTQVDALNELRVRELLRLVDKVVFMTAEQIQAKHGVPASEVLDMFQENLIPAAAELETA